MELQCKLDWFSFTFPVRTVDNAPDDTTREGVIQAFHIWTSGIFIGVVSGELWPIAQERGHYKNRIECPITSLSINWNGKDTYALCEASGRVCDALMERIDIHVLAQAANGRATRIDLAVDIECDVQPEDFVKQRDDRRFTSNGIYSSQTGQTCYVGSRSGERMARVYRYSYPHPRSHLLRAEVEYKGDAAKKLLEAMLSVPLNKLTLAAHLPFGWQHPIWQPEDAEVSKIKARAYDKANDGRWTWLMTVCWPALKKAHEEGIIDIDQLLDNWGYSKT